MDGQEDGGVGGASQVVPTGGHTRARAKSETSTRVSRLRAILNRLAEPGGGRFSDEEVSELAVMHGVGETQIRVDIGDGNTFLALADTIGGMKPFIAANLASMLVDARARGKLGDGAKLAEVLGKVTGDISPAQMNVLVDARTGALRPEVTRAMTEAQDELLAACRRAAVAVVAAVRAGLVHAGSEGEAFNAALVAEMDAPPPALVGGHDGTG